MPSHGKSKTKQTFGPKHCPKCPRGYVGSTTHRGTIIATPEMHKLLETKKLKHTDWYRSEKGNLYGKRKYT